MGGMVPSGDASRRPARFPVITALILVNAFVFVLELMLGETFVMQGSAVPAQSIGFRARADGLSGGRERIDYSS